MNQINSIHPYKHHHGFKLNLKFSYLKKEDKLELARDFRVRSSQCVRFESSIYYSDFCVGYKFMQLDKDLGILTI
jgi:hypothetical protein